MTPRQLKQQQKDGGRLEERWRWLQIKPESCGEGERWGRDGQGRRCRQTVSFVSGRLHRGRSREDQPRKKEVTSRRPVCLRARCMPLFTMPSKGATQDLLKCLTTPQAASKPAAAELLCHWLKVIQYLSTYWCVFFEGGTPRNVFMPHTAPEGRITNSPRFVDFPFIVMF